MNINYLENCKYNESIFSVTGYTEDNYIKFDKVLINPLYKFIEEKIDTIYISELCSNYIAELNSLCLKKDSDIVSGNPLTILEVNHSTEGTLEFIYLNSLETNSYLSNIQEISIELSKNLLSILENNRESLETILESKITEMLKFNYTPIEKNIIDILGISLNPDNDNINISIMSYSPLVNNSSRFDESVDTILLDIVSKIQGYLNTDNFFLIKEPTMIIKLGISTEGDYYLKTNESLVSAVNNETLEEIKNILIKTYELL